ncbi:MAG: SprT-like domain-containing protein [Pirellulaceae bacterium]
MRIKNRMNVFLIVENRFFSALDVVCDMHARDRLSRIDSARSCSVERAVLVLGRWNCVQRIRASLEFRLPAAEKNKVVRTQSTIPAKSIQPAIAELERAFAFFAHELWFKPRKVKLPRPIITIQYAGRGNRLGWFWREKWKEIRSGRTVSEINICAEHLESDNYAIAETLIHEMVHYANWLRKIRDCSSNQYHNKKFKRECENVGLICRQMGWRGWADTDLTPELEKLVDDCALSDEAFSVFRIQPGRSSGKREPMFEMPARKEKLAKWSCYCRPPVNIRVAAGVELDARCNQCGCASSGSLLRT